MTLTYYKPHSGIIGATWECQSCGALVGIDGLDIHDEFHRKLKRRKK